MSDKIYTEPGSFKFIGYTPPTMVAGPEGESILAGSEVLVEHFAQIKVSDILYGGYNATGGGKKEVEEGKVRTVAVVFDASSVPDANLSHDIRANISPGDPALALIEQAKENDEFINLVIETARNPRHSKTKEAISALAPINAIRGATTPTGKADMSSAAGMVARVVAAVNGVVTKDCRSDPSQWGELGNNVAGDLAPAGFKVLRDKEDWTKMSVIVPVDGASRPSQGGAALNADSLDELASKIVARLHEDLEVENRRYIPSARPNQISEGKPFSVRTAHGEVNLGSYQASRYRYTFAWAAEYLADKTSDDEAIHALVNTVLSLAGRVQVTAYTQSSTATNYVNLTPDFLAASYTEACRWIEWVIAHRYPYTGEPTEEWIANVGRTSTEMMVAGARSIASQVGTVQKRQPQQQAPAPSQDQPKIEASPTSQQAPTPQGSAPSQAGGDRRALAEQVIETVNGAWNDVNALRTVFTRANKECPDILGAPVESHPEHGVRFQPQNPQGTLGDVIKARGLALAAQQASAPASASAPTEAPPAPSSAEAGSGADDTPVSGDEFAQMLGGDAPAADWGERLDSIRTQAAAHAAWNDAQSDPSLASSSIVFRGGEMPLSNGFALLGQIFGKVSDLASQAYEAEDMGALNAVRAEAADADVLDFETDDLDGNQRSLRDILDAVRDSLKGGS